MTLPEATTLVREHLTYWAKRPNAQILQAWRVIERSLKKSAASGCALKYVERGGKPGGGGQGAHP